MESESRAASQAGCRAINEFDSGACQRVNSFRTHPYGAWQRCRVNILKGENAVSKCNLAPSIRTRQEVFPPGSRNTDTELTAAANRRALLKAHLWLCVKKLGRGQSIEEREIMALLPYTEANSGSGAAA